MFYKTYRKLLNLGDRYKDRQLTASDITGMIRRQFSTRDIAFITCRTNAVDPDSVIVTGLYDAENDEDDLPGIEIALNFHSEQRCYFTNLINWPQLALDVAECVGHELVHREQAKSRLAFEPYISTHPDILIQSDQEYYGAETEIEAYGFSIAAEAAATGRPYQDSAVFICYQNTFNNDPAVILRLERQIAKYLKHLGPRNE